MHESVQSFGAGVAVEAGVTCLRKMGALLVVSLAAMSMAAQAETKSLSQVWKDKQEVAGKLVDRTYIIPPSFLIKTRHAIYLSANHRIYRAIPGQGRMYFSNGGWSIRRVPGGGYGPCWDGPGRNKLCARYDQLLRTRNFPGDKFNLRSGKPSPELSKYLGH